MSKALNELRKATLASYVAKAAKSIRTHTSIAKDFDDSAYQYLKVSNKHNPNVWSPTDPHGLRKDPAKLKDAEAGYKANIELRDKFHKNAKNRIKGVALAGQKLAKEELSEEILKEYKSTESHPSLWDSHQLVHKSGKVLKKGDKVKTSDGETHTIAGFQIPHKASSTGRVFVKDKKAAFGMSVYFPSVVDAKIRKKQSKQPKSNLPDVNSKIAKAHRFLLAKRLTKEEAEQINEVSRSTIAKVATARYNQAQAALKQKDFGGYVKKMSKAIKAGNATTPVTGWSPEEDKKNEEVVPEISATEKYRQIKEAKLKKINETQVTGGEGAAIKSATTHQHYYVPHDQLKKGSSALKRNGIPHHVSDHSGASSVGHSVLNVSHKHTDKANAVLKRHGIDFGGR